MAAVTIVARLCARQVCPAAGGGGVLPGAATRRHGAVLHGRVADTAWQAASQAGASTPEHPEYSILEYDYTHHDAELLAKRAPYLDKHVKHCQEMVDQGKLLLWGSVGTPVNGGLLIWRNADQREVEAFVTADLYVTNGLVRHWVIKPFHVHVLDSS